LEKAVRKAEQAVEATPEDHPELAIYLDNLASKLARRFKRTGRIEDLEEAIRKAEQAVEATPEDHPNLAERLGSLGLHLCRSFLKSRKSAACRIKVFAFYSVDTGKTFHKSGLNPPVKRTCSFRLYLAGVGGPRPDADPALIMLEPAIIVGLNPITIFKLSSR
jgi:tetratricopeptide (TPR) repeat protein